MRKLAALIALALGMSVLVSGCGGGAPGGSEGFTLFVPDNPPIDLGK